MPYIYIIENDINDKVYIGKTIWSIEKRWKEHKNDSRRERCKDRPLYRAMRKHGIENFHVRELEYVKEIENLAEREKYWIMEYEGFSRGYNATAGGDGCCVINYKKVVDEYKKNGNQRNTARTLGICVDTVRVACNLFGEKIETSSEYMKRTTGMKINMLTRGNGEHIREFGSIHEAARWILNNGISECKESTTRSHISMACRGIRKSAFGFCWEYADIV